MKHEAESFQKSQWKWLIIIVNLNFVWSVLNLIQMLMLCVKWMFWRCIPLHSLSLQTLLIIKPMALSNSIDSSMNKSQVVVGKTKSEFRQIYLAYPDILIEAWHPLVWDSRDFILRNSMTNTTDTWRWHVSDKNSAKLIFIFHFS